MSTLVAAGPADVRAPLAVERGQWAQLRSGAGTVLVETRVEVLQDGRTGDRVRVRQPLAPSSMLARVVGPGQLEVAP
ncbi:MAG TPA: flagella basal body P-ring formation protein FlgA [Ramlibacter sp.]|nr:flagella basal body P-ring formation protein FlgA [Ramlibacter sp.]